MQHIRIIQRCRQHGLLLALACVCDACQETTATCHICDGHQSLSFYSVLSAKYRQDPVHTCWIAKCMQEKGSFTVGHCTTVDVCIAYPTANCALQYFAFSKQVAISGKGPRAQALEQELCIRVRPVQALPISISLLFSKNSMRHQNFAALVLSMRSVASLYLWGPKEIVAPILKLSNVALCASPRCRCPVP